MNNVQAKQSTASKELLRCENLSKNYQEGDRVITVLDNVSFSIATQELIAIVGKSGSGKSTLLHLLGGLDTPSNGKVMLKGHNLAELNANELAKFRNQYLGFVYQFHHLMADFTSLENVMIPLLIAGKSKDEATEQAIQMIEKVELKHRIKHKPAELSGGERQRIAIARALVNNPALVLADEPTGNLDNKTSATIFELMQKLNQEQGTAFLLVTHDLSLASQFERQIVLTDGQMQTMEN